MGLGLEILDLRTSYKLLRLIDNNIIYIASYIPEAYQSTASIVFSRKGGAHVAQAANY